MLRTAILSDDRRMRWELQRVWSETLTPSICTFLLLNPSTADSESDDPTTKRCMAYARYWNYDGVRLINLVGFRATEPMLMYSWLVRQASADLLVHVERAVAGAKGSTKIIVGHGSLHPGIKRHARTVVSAISKQYNLYALKLNKDGSPAHPLYLPGNLCPRLYVPETSHV